jgi:hypothetical protein
MLGMAMNGESCLHYKDFDVRADTPNKTFFGRPIYAPGCDEKNILLGIADKLHAERFSAVIVAEKVSETRSAVCVDVNWK